MAVDSGWLNKECQPLRCLGMKTLSESIPYYALAEIGGERLSEGLMHLVSEKALCFDALRLSE